MLLAFYSGTRYNIGYNCEKSQSTIISGDVLLWRDTYINICESSLTKKDVKKGHTIIADSIANRAADLVTKVQKTAANYFATPSFVGLTA